MPLVLLLLALGGVITQADEDPDADVTVETEVGSLLYGCLIMSVGIVCSVDVQTSMLQ